MPCPRALSLAGVGVRVKQIGPIKAKVYAIGVYVDKVSVIKSLKSSLSKTYQDLLKSAKFLEEVTSRLDTVKSS